MEMKPAADVNNHCDTMTSATSDRPQDGQAHAREIVREFMQNTTAHGWGHAVRTRNPPLRALWVFIILLALAMNVCHVAMLVLQYLQFPYEQVSRVEVDEIVFPSVTICNILPMSTSSAKVSLANGTSKFSQWNNTTQYFFNHMVNESTDVYRLRRLYERMRGPRGFYENIGEEVSSLGHQPQDFILSCTFAHGQCSWQNVTKFQSSTYFNCYTFNGGNSSAAKLMSQMTGPQAGLSLVLYLESDSGDLMHDAPYYTFLNVGNAAGARVIIHSPDTRPSPMDHGFDIPPGYSSSVGLEVSRHDRLGKPYGDCHRKLSSKDSPYRYSTHECTMDCQQAFLVKKCSCYSADLPINSEYSSTMPYCGYYNESNPIDIFNRTECEARSTLKFLTSEKIRARCSCYAPCMEYEYSTDVSYSYWPVDISQETFYNIYVAENPQRDTLKAWHNLKDFNMSQLISQGLIRKNFVRLNIYIKSLVIQEYIQQESYTFFNLFSDIGGTFGLWIGMSLLTWGEVLELVIKMSFRWCQKLSSSVNGQSTRVTDNPSVKHSNSAGTVP